MGQTPVFIGGRASSTRRRRIRRVLIRDIPGLSGIRPGNPILAGATSFARGSDQKERVACESCVQGTVCRNRFRSPSSPDGRVGLGVSRIRPALSHLVSHPKTFGRAPRRWRADYKDHFAAEIYKSYLVSACRVIRSEDGELVAFDGDRVMAVYLGDGKNSSAARTALKINWTVEKVVNPAVKKQYPNTSYSVAHAVGIDTGKLFVARTGIRGSNDLVWVGRAANHAAKLCELRDVGYSSCITEGVYGKLNDAAKYGGSPRQDMWEKRTWSGTGRTVYRSNFWWKL